MKPIIEVHNLSKKYRISHQKEGMAYDTLRDELVNTFKKPLYWLTGKRENQEDIWALKNVSFSVEPGEILGIIGPNGAGKSTLLKILTRITPPSEGRAVIRGRVGSLLEVGTGFHPELTGRENIYLNGAILGMRKKEIDEKFDEIVEFAGIEKFLDTPAKRYSSGMYVRLAFSVAAHLESDILLVDEVLSVGDASFQKKSLGKMQEVTKKGKRTIFFVSHNMGAVRNLCETTILLDKGGIAKVGKTEEVVNYYLNNKEIRSPSVIEYQENKAKRMQIRKIKILDENNKPGTELDPGRPFNVDIEYDANDPLENMSISLHVFSIDGSWVLVSVESETNKEDYQKLYCQKREKGRYIARVKFPKNLFNAGVYRLKFIINLGTAYFDVVDNINISFYDSGDFHQKYQAERGGLISVPIPWETQKIN